MTSAMRASQPSRPLTVESAYWRDVVVLRASTSEPSIPPPGSLSTVVVVAEAANLAHVFARAQCDGLCRTIQNMGDDRIDEAKLWSRSLEGDGAAFGELFDAYRDRVYRHAYRLLRNPHDAEDATAVAFKELWRRRDSVRLVNDSILPWLLVTTANSALNLQRSQRRYRRLLSVLPRAEDSPSAEDISLESLNPLSSELSEALGRLSQRNAALLILTAVEGLPLSDAATVLGLSPGAAASRLFRIRATLQKALQQSALLPISRVEGKTS